MPSRHFLVLCLLLVFLPTCAPLPTATPPPTPQALFVQRPLILQGWDARLYACAVDFPQIALFIAEQAPEPSLTGSLSLELHYGAPNQSNENTYILGYEDLLLAANISFPANELTLPQLQEIYHGQTASSQAIAPTDQDFPLQAWTYPNGELARQVFDKAVLHEPSQALIAPSPQAMLEALADQAGAVGYLPASAFSLADETQKAQIKELELKEVPADIFRKPILFLLPAELSDLLNAFLQCLQ